MFSSLDSADAYFYEMSEKKYKELSAQGVDLEAVKEFDTKLEDTAYANREIGVSLQQNNDCWLLSSLNALNTTKKGKEYIKEAIQVNDDGTYAVNLKGINKTYTITPQDLKDNKSLISHGDTDVKLVEIAVLRYNRELIKTNQASDHEYDYTSFTGKESTEENPLKGGGTPYQALYYLTGKTSKVKTIPKYANTDKVEKGTYIQNDEVKKYLDNIMNNKGEYAACCFFTNNKKSEGITTQHAYAIKRVEKNNVIITNPWNSALEFSISRKKFMQTLEDFTVCDLNK